jgi:membrane protein DedA with SNARE-associated domain
MFFAIPAQIGYGALFGLVFAESAGAPVPGETALLAAGALAGSGHLLLPLVIAVGTAAAILGDNLGYWLGRRGGRALLLRDGRFAGHRRRAVAKGDAFFARHGAKTVFLGRWVPGVRVVGAVLAGASAMPWRRFLLFNATGALAWSATVASVAAVFGLAGAASWMALTFAAALLAGALAALRQRRARTPRQRAASRWPWRNRHASSAAEIVAGGPGSGGEAPGH